VPRGVYYSDGNRAAGPPPLPLFRYDVAVANGEVQMKQAIVPISTTLCQALQNIWKWLDDRSVSASARAGDAYCTAGCKVVVRLSAAPS